MTAGIYDNVFVKRGEWWRGHGSTGSGLLRSDGTRCCLGFAASQQCGVSDSELLDIAAPKGSYWRYEPEHAKDIEDFNTSRDPWPSTTRQLMIANDLTHYTEPERERRVHNLGKQIGLYFVFTD